MRSNSTFLLLLLLLSSCTKNEEATQPNPNDTMYFPSNTNATWETKSLSSLAWNQNAVPALKEYLSQKNTKSFIILVNGRIVMEEYFEGHTENSSWAWNSAGKTLVAAITGFAQQEGLLNINNKASDYLGAEWSSMPSAKENLITVKNLLNMTAGNDDTKQYVIKANISYVADAGIRWAYSNVFQKLMDVVGSCKQKII
jgi:CubicO group peptidase (beta-lactamase class C family)